MKKIRLFEMGCRGIFPSVSFDKQHETETKNIAHAPKVGYLHPKLNEDRN